MMTVPSLRLGTRASALARWQAEWVAAQLAGHGVQVTLVPITTRGDTQQHDSIGAVGGTGVFTKELERALLAGTIDLAVHSLKDLPTESDTSLVLAAVPERESVRDALVARQGLPLDRLPAGAIVGTGSLRRQAQLLHLRHDLCVRPVRGNVDTRLEKLAAGQFDALLLAEAGLNRLSRSGTITQLLDPLSFLPAIGQGALGIQSRRDDDATRTAVKPLDHEPTHRAVTAERALLAALAGGCLAPVGAWARAAENATLQLDAVVLSADGRQRLVAAAAGTDAVHLGQDVAERLLSQGAAALIEQSRRTQP